MSDDFAIEWWESRRLRYNVSLLISGLLAFVCYVWVLDRAINSNAIPDAEFTILTLAVYSIGYVFMSGMANLCFCAGAFVENRFVGPPNVRRYRRLAFPLGFWFSVLLPFTIPLRVVVETLAHLSPR